MCELADQITRLINKYNNNLLASYKLIDNLIREQKIFIPKYIVDNWHRDEVTLKRAECKSDILVSEYYKYYEIKANTVGPLYPIDYFNNKHIPLILFLLKEPFIEKDSWYKNDHGGNNQVDVWKSSEYPTQQKAIEYAKKFLLELGVKYDNPDNYLKHICVINVQLFPGLAFIKNGSDDNLLKPWALENRSLIETLIDFFNPKYVIGGHTLKYYFKSKQEDSVILGENIIYRNLQFNNYYFVTGSGRVFIDAYHPSASQFNIEDGLIDAQYIKKILLNKVWP